MSSNSSKEASKEVLRKASKGGPEDWGGAGLVGGLFRLTTAMEGGGAVGTRLSRSARKNPLLLDVRGTEELEEGTVLYAFSGCSQDTRVPKSPKPPNVVKQDSSTAAVVEVADLKSASKFTSRAVGNGF